MAGINIHKSTKPSIQNAVYPLNRRPLGERKHIGISRTAITILISSSNWFVFIRWFGVTVTGDLYITCLFALSGLEELLKLIYFERAFLFHNMRRGYIFVFFNDSWGFSLTFPAA